MSEAGVAHEYGLGVSKNLREAARWYSLAAAQGLAESNYHLGLMKAHGRGFAQDLSGAAIHFQKVPFLLDPPHQGLRGFTFKRLQIPSLMISTTYLYTFVLIPKASSLLRF